MPDFRVAWKRAHALEFVSCFSTCIADIIAGADGSLFLQLMSRVIRADQGMCTKEITANPIRGMIQASGTRHMHALDFQPAQLDFLAVSRCWLDRRRHTSPVLSLPHRVQTGHTDVGA